VIKLAFSAILTLAALYVVLAQRNLDIVKRVIGTAGDTLRMTHDTVYRKGAPLDEPYAAHSEERAVPEEILDRIRACFVLGDNRDDSWDSRFHGFVPTANIEGAPRFVYFSRDPAGGVRWGRIGRQLQ
jgi:signal peptidase I